MSMVNSVDVELSMEAREEMMAAARAAKVRPFTPTGVKLRTSQG